MKTAYGRLFLKKLISASLLILSALVFCLIFSHLYGINYSLDGVNGTLSNADISLSIVFCCFSLIFYFISGLCALPGTLTAISALMLFKLFIALAGFLGYSYLFEPLNRIYFLLITPIVPILEGISSISILSANSDMLFIILPTIFSLLTLSSFCFGYHVRFRPEIVRRSLRRIDRFYEYRAVPNDGTEINTRTA